MMYYRQNNKPKITKKEFILMNKGFSLVELIVVIAIMAILVGVAVPAYTGYITKANNAVDEQLADEIDRAIETLLIDPSVDNPTESTTMVTITLANSTYTIAGTSTTENNPFIAELTKIVPPAALKGDTYKNGIVFTIDGYSCSYKAVAGS